MNASYEKLYIHFLSLLIISPSLAASDSSLDLWLAYLSHVPPCNSRDCDSIDSDLFTPPDTDFSIRKRPQPLPEEKPLNNGLCSASTTFDESTKRQRLLISPPTDGFQNPSTQEVLTSLTDQAFFDTDPCSPIDLHTSILDEPEQSLFRPADRTDFDELSSDQGASSGDDPEPSNYRESKSAILLPKTFYPCTHRCNFCTESICTWLKHLHSEHQETVVQCPYEHCGYACGTASRSKRALFQLHIETKHIAPMDFPYLVYRCLPGCGYQTLSIHSWQKHLHDQHKYTNITCPFEGCSYKAKITSRAERTALDNHVRRKHH